MIHNLSEFIIKHLANLRSRGTCTVYHSGRGFTLARLVGVVLYLNSYCVTTMAMRVWCVVLVICWLSACGHCLVEEPLVTEKVYLDLEVEGAPAESIIIGLFGATSPKTVKNFVALANHEVRLVQTGPSRVVLFRELNAV